MLDMVKLERLLSKVPQTVSIDNLYLGVLLLSAKSGRMQGTNLTNYSLSKDKSVSDPTVCLSNCRLII